MTGEPQPKYTLILARIGGLLGLPLQTVCTSMLVFHRRKVNPDVQITAEMLVACLSASMKTHENSKKLRDILECTHSVLGIPTDKNIPGLRDTIMELERVILCGESAFALAQIEHPHRLALAMLRTLNLDADVAEVTWGLISQSFHTPEILKYPPQTIAYGVIHITLRILHLEIDIYNNNEMLDRYSIRPLELVECLIDLCVIYKLLAKTSAEEAQFAVLVDEFKNVESTIVSKINDEKKKETERIQNSLRIAERAKGRNERHNGKTWDRNRSPARTNHSKNTYRGNTSPKNSYSNQSQNRDRFHTKKDEDERRRSSYSNNTTREPYRNERDGYTGGGGRTSISGNGRVPNDNSQTPRALNLNGRESSRDRDRVASRSRSRGRNNEMRDSTGGYKKPNFSNRHVSRDRNRSRSRSRNGVSSDDVANSSSRDRIENRSGGDKRDDDRGRGKVYSNRNTNQARDRSRSPDAKRGNDERDRGKPNMNRSSGFSGNESPWKRYDVI